MGTPHQKPIPGNKKVTYCTRYWHYRAKRWMVAADYGYKAWRFLGSKKVS